MNTKILTTPINSLQKEWFEAFNAAADAGQNELLLDEIKNNFDQNEWAW